MDYKKAVSKIYEDVYFNQACFNFSEEEARSKKLWRDERPMPTQEQLDEAQIIVQKEMDIEAIYNTMVQEVEAEMLVVFGTSNVNSASAFAQTYEAMLKRPANYVDAGLGLNSPEEVAGFATVKLATIDAYGVFRLNKINTFSVAKQAILDA